jgi:tetraacyldisaccharide 4'-kinase
MRPETIWYGGHWLAYPLLPLSWVYRFAVAARRTAYRRGWLETRRLPVPVIVVGNLTVGGTGKTPLVLWLASFLLGRGFRPGILSRGYGGTARDWPRLVPAQADPNELGDEGVLLARRGVCPVAAGPDRIAAGRLLLEEASCDIIVCDDGLQHYRLARDIEILVVDAARGLGNGYCLPAGPLREPGSRVSRVALRVCNGGNCFGAERMDLVPGGLTSLRDATLVRPLSSLRRQRVTAVAGTGNPERFFTLLRSHGLHLDERPYPDHYRYGPGDAASWPPGPVVMTEKDAVKCLPFAGRDHWFLPVDAQLGAGFERQISEELKGLENG